MQFVAVHLVAVILLFTLSPTGSASSPAQPVIRTDSPSNVSQTPSPKDSAIALPRGDLGRTGVFNSTGVAVPSGVDWESQKLFVMKRESVAMTGGREFGPIGSTIILMGGAYTHSYGFGVSIPIAAGGSVFFTLFIGDGYLYALDSETGRLKWVTKREKGIFSDVCVADNTLFVGADHGLFYALDLKGQREAWRNDLKNDTLVTGSPAVWNGTVYFGRDNGTLYARDAKTGSEKWTYVTGTDTYVLPPAIGNGMVYFGSASTIFSVDAISGKALWKFDAAAEIHSVMLANGTLFAVDVGGYIHSFDATTGKVLPSSRQLGESRSVLAFKDDTLFFRGRDSGDIFAIDINSRKQKWKFITREPCSAPTLARNLIYTTCADGKLYALDAASGKKLWAVGEFKPSLSRPFVGDGVIYLISDDGKVHAVR